MLYFQKEPSIKLARFIKKFWQVDSNNEIGIHEQKVIPDGYPEIIFHYQNEYKIKINDSWKLQSKYLLAGQFRNYFYLKNSGRSGMSAITFQPWALKTLFNINMSAHLDKVLPLDSELLKILNYVKTISISTNPFENKVSAIEEWFIKYLKGKKVSQENGEVAAQLIINEKGLISLQEIQQKINISERSLERYFKKNIGISPKFYSRVIRLSNIFKLIQEGKTNWADIIYQSGFYDQSHFIKNFKEFTGEEPSNYGFNEQNMANFFLSK